MSRSTMVAVPWMLVAIAACGAHGGGGVELRVIEVELDPSVAGAGPGAPAIPTPANSYYVALDVEIINGTSDDLPLGLLAFRLLGDSGISHDASPITEVLEGGCITGRYVTGGSMASCWVAFALADDELPAELAYNNSKGDQLAAAEVTICPPEIPDLCGHDCVDLASDRDNCGACGVETRIGCIDGVPSCADLTACDDVCVDTRIDPNNCGGCGITTTLMCIDGEPSCGTLTACDGTCVDTSSDPANCGACGQAIWLYSTCVDGEVLCDPGYEDCGQGECADLATDRYNCGECGNALEDQDTRCLDGQTVCTNPTSEFCGGVCTDIASDIENCGGCGQECPIPENPAYERSCRNGNTCAAEFPTPGGACETQCEFNGWSCSYTGAGVCPCESSFSPGACTCRCVTSPN